jgi:hypothetical protein
MFDRRTDENVEAGVAGAFDWGNWSPIMW